MQIRTRLVPQAAPCDRPRMKDLLTDILGDVISEGLWEAVKGAPAWVYYLLSVGCFGAAAFFYFGMNQSFWTWPSLVLAVILFVVAIVGG